MKDWREHNIECQESESAERAVSYLHEAGHPEARRACQRKIRNDDHAVELDGIAIASDCAVIVEAKTVLTANCLEDFIQKLSTLRYGACPGDEPELAGHVFLSQFVKGCTILAFIGDHACVELSVSCHLFHFGSQALPAMLSRATGAVCGAFAREQHLR